METEKRTEKRTEQPLSLDQLAAAHGLDLDADISDDAAGFVPGMVYAPAPNVINELRALLQIGSNSAWGKPRPTNPLGVEVEFIQGHLHILRHARSLASQGYLDDSHPGYMRMTRKGLRAFGILQALPVSERLSRWEQLRAEANDLTAEYEIPVALRENDDYAEDCRHPQFEAGRCTECGAPDPGPVNYDFTDLHTPFQSYDLLSEQYLAWQRQMRLRYEEPAGDAQDTPHLAVQAEDEEPDWLAVEHDRPFDFAWISSQIDRSFRTREYIGEISDDGQIAIMAVQTLACAHWWLAAHRDGRWWIGGEGEAITPWDAVQQGTGWLDEHISSPVLPHDHERVIGFLQEIIRLLQLAAPQRLDAFQQQAVIGCLALSSAQDEHNADLEQPQ